MKGRWRSDFGSEQQRFRLLVLVPPIAIIGGLMGYAFVSLAYYALHSVDIYSLTPKAYVGLGNFIDLAGSRKFWRAVTNTGIWIVASVAAISLLGLATGVFLGRDSLIVRFTRAFMLVPWVLPGVVVAALWKWIYEPQNGILNDMLVQAGVLTQGFPWLGTLHSALFAVAAAITWRLFPLFALVIASAVKGIDPTLYEAAEIDGAGGWRLFRYITLPGISDQLMTMTLLVTIWVANNLVFVEVMTGGGPIGSTEILPTYLYGLAFDTGDLGLSAAVSLVNGVLLAAIGTLYVRAMRRANAMAGR